MEEKQILTTEDKRLQKIAQLKARLQKEEARLNQDKRKERDGQLIAFGVLVEELFKAGDPVARQKWQDGAKKHLNDRNLKRALAGFSRLDANPSQKKDQSNGVANTPVDADPEKA
jgi:hypothetical protein